MENIEEYMTSEHSGYDWSPSLVAEYTEAVYKELVQTEQDKRNIIKTLRSTAYRKPRADIGRSRNYMSGKRRKYNVKDYKKMDASYAEDLRA